MGYVKYKEDDIDIISERSYLKGRVSNRGNFGKVFVKCYFCSHGFPSLELRNRHIRDSHNMSVPILIANGKVVNKIIHLKAIDEVLIETCDVKDLNVSINDKPLVLDPKNTNYDIKQYIKENYSNRILLNSIEYVVNHKQPLSIRSNQVDSIVQEWEINVSKGECVIKNYPRTLNESEKRYLDGVYNYFIACVSECDKQKRYEDAYTLLSEFDKKTAHSLCILRVIAFRLNWVDKLKSLCNSKSTTFNHAWYFFNNESSNQEVEADGNIERNLYIEDDQDSVLHAIILYQEENYLELNEYLKKFSDEFIYEISDTNYKDKILLLKARMAIKQGFKDKANGYYADIITPFFDYEREQYRATQI
jgi:hypothetical protein